MLIKKKIEGEKFELESPMMTPPSLTTVSGDDKKELTEKQRRQAQVLADIYMNDRWYRRNL